MEGARGETMKAGFSQGSTTSSIIFLCVPTAQIKSTPSFGKEACAAQFRSVLGKFGGGMLAGVECAGSVEDNLPLPTAKGPDLF